MAMMAHFFVRNNSRRPNHLAVRPAAWHGRCKIIGNPMNPIVTTLVLAVTILSATAALALIRALLRAEQGYEDETGFHPGSESSAPRA